MDKLTKAQKQIIISALLTEIHDLRAVLLETPTEFMRVSAQDALKKRRDIIKLLSKRSDSDV